MIEATLDRTLLPPNPTKQIAKSSVQKVFRKINVPISVENFIAQLATEVGVDKKVIEDYFWELLHNGDILLLPDLKVQIRQR